MTVSDILDIDSFDDEWTNNDYDVPMMVDAQQVMVEVSPDHATSASGGEPSSESEKSDGGTEEDYSQSEEDGDDDEDDEDDEERSTRDETLARLEDMVLDLLEQLSEALPDVLPDEQAKQGGHSSSRNRSGHKRLMIRLADRRKPPQADGSYGTRCVIFPQSSKSLAQLFRVIDFMHEAITDGIPTTKRDIFYKDVQLFERQATVNKLVDDIAATIGGDRADLHVRASAKGLFCGAGLTIYMRQGDTIQGNARESTLIPPSEDIIRYDISDTLSWVLVVEKEAIFQTLCHLGFSENSSLPGTGIIITGKGYPDVATRQLVCTLSANLPDSIPVFALVDADPYGIDILSTYKHGSASMMHQQDSLAAPRVKWIGVMSSELSGLGINKDVLLPISKHDEKKALSMLRRPNLPRKWRKELQHMLFVRRKAEIEVLCAANNNPKLTRTDKSFLDSDEGFIAPKQQENTLTRYLAAKIGVAVNNCGARDS